MSIPTPSSAGEVYDTARDGFLRGQIDWTNDLMTLVAFDEGYTPAVSDYDFSVNVPGAAVLATRAIAGLGARATQAGGIATAPMTTLLAADLPPGDTITGFLIYCPTTLKLICYITEDADGNAIEIPTAGEDVRVKFGAGTGQVFRI